MLGARVAAVAALLLTFLVALFAQRRLYDFEFWGCMHSFIYCLFALLVNSQALKSSHGAVSSFKELGLSDWLCSVCTTLRIARPTPVQSACIQPILSGRHSSKLGQQPA